MLTAFRALTAGLLAIAAPTAAQAAPLTGQYTLENPVASPVGRCAPAARTVVFGPGNLSAAGTSNLGDFVPSGSHCITPPPAPYNDGVFTFAFDDGATLTGVRRARFARAPAKPEACEDAPGIPVALRAYASDVARIRSWCQPHSFIPAPANPRIAHVDLADPRMRA